MNREFSEGFIQDLRYLLEQCVLNETDNLELSLDFNGTELQVYMEFSARK